MSTVITRVPLACPACRAALNTPDDVFAGAYTCTGCARVYPVEGRVARFLADDRPDAATARTGERFGYEWTRFSEILPQYERQFLAWIAPLAPRDFEGRVVIDGGCGKGRHLRLAAAFGAREVIGVDVGSAVEAAVANTAGLPNVRVLQADLRRPPLAPGSADLVYSVGVLHHLAEPRTGFRALAALVRPGGRMLAWVYGREGNAWVRYLVTPLRLLTGRLPLPVVRALAFGLAAVLWTALRTAYARPALARRLPYATYLRSLLGFPFREIHAITFDHLLAPVAHYLAREEVAAWFAGCGLRLESLRWHNRNSWSALGVRDGAGGA